MSITDFRLKQYVDPFTRVEGGRVLVAIDGGQAGWDALDWAAEEAAARSGTLHIGYAVTWSLPLSAWGFTYLDEQNTATGAAADQILDEALARAHALAPSTPADATLLGGAAAGAIPIEGRRASLIVIGRQYPTGWDGKLLGPTSWQVARRSRTPVVTVGAPYRPAIGPSAGRIVVALGETDDPSALLGFAFRAAVLRSVGVTVLHVTGRTNSPGSARGGTADFYQGRRIDDALRRAQDMFPEVPTRRRLVSGHVGTVLLAESSGAALTVLGSQRTGRFRIRGLRSTGRQVVTGSTSPIAIISAKR